MVGKVFAGKKGAKYKVFEGVTAATPQLGSADGLRV